MARSNRQEFPQASELIRKICAEEGLSINSICESCCVSKDTFISFKNGEVLRTDSLVRILHSIRHNLGDQTRFEQITLGLLDAAMRDADKKL